MSRLTHDLCDLLHVPHRHDIEAGGSGTTHEVPRMRPKNATTNPMAGRVVWNPTKSLWFTGHLFVALVGGWYFFSYGAVLLSFVFTVTTLCVGHTIGLHRLLVHRSFKCAPWLEYCLVHLGTAVGMGGPYRILYMHDIRDWAQRHPKCHAFYIHQNSIWKDCLWQLHCELRLQNPPRFEIEPSVARDRVHRFVQHTWMLQQLPWALLFYLMGGLGFVVWGISVRIVISLTGHWLVGYFAHNAGTRDWLLNGHAVQGFNVPGISLLTMGESLHNNHHAFPDSAKLSVFRNQLDPGWWILRAFQSFGLIWDIKLPDTLPDRPELHALTKIARNRLAEFKRARAAQT